MPRRTSAIRSGMAWSAKGPGPRMQRPKVRALCRSASRMEAISSSCRQSLLAGQLSQLDPVQVLAEAVGGILADRFQLAVEGVLLFGRRGVAADGAVNRF